MKATLIRYSPRRFAKGLPAAEVRMRAAGNSLSLWMTIGDVAENVMRFGELKGLTDALAAYKANVAINEDRFPGP